MVHLQNLYSSHTTQSNVIFFNLIYFHKYIMVENHFALLSIGLLSMFDSLLTI